MNIQCGNCGARLVVEAELRTTECPYCGSTSVVDRPPSGDREAPHFAIGFGLTREQVRARVAHWLQGCWFAKSGFKQAALEQIRGVYLPSYLYSAIAETDFSARIGENYTETETYTTRENGRTVRKTRTVTKTEWRPLSGRRTEYVADRLVSASKGLPNEQLEAIEPFELAELRRYSPALLSGWIAEEPTRGRDECLQLGRAEAVEEARRRLERFMPGDTHADLRGQTLFRDESLELCLVPVWVMAARYRPDAPPARVLVNGQTGAVWGEIPRSWVKISLVVLATLALVGAAVLYFGQ